MVGRRVRIDPLRAEDADEVISANRTSRAFHAPWATPCIDRAGFDAWLATAEGPAHCALLIRRIVDGELAGVVNFSQIAMGNFRSAYLGYHANAALAGRGLMREGLRLAVDHGFAKIGLHRVEANIQPENRISLALIGRLGFRKEGFSPRYLMIDGQWRDHERWAITTEEWSGPDD